MLDAWRHAESNDSVLPVRVRTVASVRRCVLGEQSHQVRTERFIRLGVARRDHSACDLRTAVNAVYAEGVDPNEFAVTVVEDVEQTSTGSCPQESISTPACSYGSTGSGADHEQGEHV